MASDEGVAGGRPDCWVVGKIWMVLTREERIRRREVGGEEMWKME